MSQGLQVHKGSYLDSLVLMSATVSMEESPGVTWAGAFMGTRQAHDDLVANGFSAGDLADAGPNDVVLAAKADDDGALDAALEAGRATAFRREESTAAVAEAAPASIADAVAAGDINVAIVSVPGEYAALETHHALTAGLHVLLFSDGVSLAEEVELKTRAASLGRLVMGPGAGTSIIGGTGLGFANVMTSQPTSNGAVGVVAAAGTGAQEVSSLLSRWGVRVVNVIGVGGRDLSDNVAGRAAKLATRALDHDEGTSAVLLVSKPPSPAVAADVLAQCQNTPAVAVFLGLDESANSGNHKAKLARTLESGARAAAELVGVTAAPSSQGLTRAVAAACAELALQRTIVRGFFSGGTLCYEAQLLLEEFLGPIYSNEPLRKEHHVPAPAGAHVLLDLGAEEYTRGVPHPMIDPHRRIELLREQARDEQTAVVLLDVVLGYGSHEDPAGELAPVLAELMSESGPRVVAYVLGTEDDPQGYSRQRAKLEDVGCIVPETNARAALVAAAIAARRPEIAESSL